MSWSDDNQWMKKYMDYDVLLLRLAPLRVHSATGCQQPPEWSVLGQVDCISPWQPVGVEVILHRLHPGHLRSSWWLMMLRVLNLEIDRPKRTWKEISRYENLKIKKEETLVCSKWRRLSWVLERSVMTVWVKVTDCFWCCLTWGVLQKGP